MICLLCWYVPPVAALTSGQTREEKPKPPAPQERPAVRVLTNAEMGRLMGAGQYRIKGFSGSHPWWPTYRAGVTVGTGNVSAGGTDLAIPAGRGLGVSVQRTYNSHDDTVGPFGIGWSHSFDVFIKEDAAGQEEHKKKDGTRAFVLRNADGLYTPPEWSRDTYTSTYQAVDNGDGTLRSEAIEDTIVTKEGMRYSFQKKGTVSSTPLRRLTTIKDRNDNQITLTYGTAVTYANGDTDTLLSSVEDSVGRQITFTWTNFGSQQNPIYRVTSISDGTRTVSYQYNTDFNLWKVTQTVGGVNRIWMYTYTTQNGETGLLASVADPVGNTITYSYQFFTALNCIWVYRVMEPSGFGTEYGPTYPGYPIVYVHLNSLGLSGSNPFGDSSHSLPSMKITGLWTHAMSTGPNRDWTWDSQMNLTRYTKTLVLSPNEHYSRFTDMTYDSKGNLLTVTDPLDKVTTYTYYGADKYYQRETATDALGRVTRYDYGRNSDAAGQRGSLLWVRDARYSQTGRQMSFTYNGYGQKTQMTDFNNGVTDYTYGDSWGNLTQVRQDPTGLNRTTTMQYDALGRVTQSTDPRNQTTTLSYNEANQPTSVAYPGETVSYGYNADGSAASVTDNRGTTGFTYQYGRVTDATDPVTGTIHYTYDPIGNRTSVQAPNGETTTYTWDYNDWYGEYPNLWLGLAKVTDHWGKETTYTFFNTGQL
ncbi:MAG: RHS repeat protein, partial [Armatimonadetes bacterium]|nr:RHS repeat protein [Armatimonadota bacterium]